MAERSAAERLKDLVEAAEAEAAQSREAVGRVGERADDLARRVDELAAGVAEALEALREEIAALREASEAEAPPPEEDPATRVEPSDDELIAEAEAAAPEAAPAEPAAPEAAPAEPAAPEAAPAEPAAPEGARLLALKMALDGRPRAETAAYLRENFDLAEPDALLDEVYARAEARK